MKVLLVHPGMGPGHSKIYPPLGAMGIARYLAAMGIESKVVDLTGLNVDKALPPLLYISQPDVLGITTLIGEVARRACEATDLAKRICPSIRIAWGGPLVSSDPEWVGSLPSVDAAFRGDGEEQLLWWIEHGMPKQLVVGERVDSDPDSSFGGLHELQREYILPAKFSPELRTDSVFVTSHRGCPGQCPFCYLRSHAPGRIRTTPPGSLINKLEAAVSCFDVRGFYFLDDSFTGNHAWTQGFCATLIQRDLGIHWFCDSRIEDLHPAILDQLYRAGARSFYIGIESGSDRIRRRLKKTMPVDAVKDRVAHVLGTGFSVKLSIVVGWPEETADDLERTLDLAMEFPTAQLDVYRYFPLPGTPLGEQVLTSLSEADRLQIRFWNWETIPTNLSAAPDAVVDRVQSMLVFEKNIRHTQALS